MASRNSVSRSDASQQQGRFWLSMTGLPSDIVVEVGDMSLHLHKFPLLSKSAVLGKLIEESTGREEGDACVIRLPDLPGGAKAFEHVAKFCYGMKLEFTASNIMSLRCAAEHLGMTEGVSEGNLIAQTETFLDQVVLRSWADTLGALHTCEDLLPFSEDLRLTRRCIDSLAAKASTGTNQFGWPVVEYGSMQSPGGSVLWNGINTGAKPMNCTSDWWYKDVSSLSLPMYKQLISANASRGMRQEAIAGSLAFYAARHFPGLNRHHSVVKTAIYSPPLTSEAVLPEEFQRNLLEEIEALLPCQKGAATTKFLFGLLRTAMILGASSSCSSNLEKRIGSQLEEASLEDLLMPNFSGSTDMLYDVDCAHRILEHFLAMDKAKNGGGAASPSSSADGDERSMGSLSLTPITMVARLVDGYLAEIAPDVNLKLPNFQSLAAAVPDYARPLDDGLYRAVDIYLKAHPWLTELEREQLCRLMDCQKLSLEACTHAAQNNRLPLRVVIQVLFFEQLQLRTSIAGCLTVSDNQLGGSASRRSSYAVPPDELVEWKENQNLKVGMDSMRLRVSELEIECSNMKREIDKLGREQSQWNSAGAASRSIKFKLKSTFCSAQKDSVSNQGMMSLGPEALQGHKAKAAAKNKKLQLCGHED